MAPGRWYCPCFRPETDDVTVLDYSHFNLDDVPSEVFSFERTLEELYLDANQIKDLPRPLFHCHGLRKLIISDNEIQSLPPAVASLINLEELDISKNGILEIPDNINGCKRLLSVEASVNPLGRLPEGFTQLLNLEELYLNDTFLEYLPANFGRLCHLRILELRENHLKVLPKSIMRLSELTRLDIGQNDFVELPEVIGSLSKLTELWCDGNRILKVPPCLGNLKKLGYLDASKNKIQEIAPEVDGCISMTDLTLSHNKIRHLPHTLGNLRKLSVIHIENNHISSIPPSIGNLQCLEELVMSNNNIHSLPSSFGLLRSLHTLMADDNCIESLPREIGSCVSLSILSLRNNRLTFVPDEIGHIARLRVVNLVSNHLCNLPFSIAKLPNLHALWLSENQAKPLVPLQSDVDAETGQRVLTCFMLPQSPLDQSGIEPTTPDSEAEREGRQQIKFSSDVESERPGKLVRAPTPYPKELKAHARHARNFVLKKLEVNGTYAQYPLDDKSPSDEMEPDSIREELAKQNEGSDNSYRNSRNPENSNISETVDGNHHPRQSESPSFPSLRPQDPEQTVRKWEESCLNSVVREDVHARQEKIFNQDRNPSPSQITKQLKKQFFDGLPNVHQNTGSGNYSPDGRKYYCHPSYNNSSAQMKSAVPTSTNSFVQRGPRFSSPVSQTAPLSLAHKFATLPTTCGTYPPPRAGSHVSHNVDVKSDSRLDTDRQNQAPNSGQRKSLASRSGHQPSPQQTAAGGNQSSYSQCSSPISQNVAASPKPYSEMGYQVNESNYPGSRLNTYSIAWYTGPNVPPRDGPILERANSEIEYKRQSLSESLPSPSPHCYQESSRHSDTSAPNSYALNSGERSRSYRSLESAASQYTEEALLQYISDKHQMPVSSTNYPIYSNIYNPREAVSHAEEAYNQEKSSFSRKSPIADKVIMSRSHVIHAPTVTRQPTPFLISQCLNPNVDTRLQNKSPVGVQNSDFMSRLPDHSSHNKVDCGSRNDQNPRHLDAHGSGQLSSSRESHDSSLNSSTLPSKYKHNKQWLFGSHKNPMVFPVSIQRNPDIGFTYEGGIGSPVNLNRPEDEGIYITHVSENGPANALLKPGDKILEVNGVDFTRVDQKKAAVVLHSSGPCVTLLVSRC